MVQVRLRAVGPRCTLWIKYRERRDPVVQRYEVDPNRQQLPRSVSQDAPVPKRHPDGSTGASRSGLPTREGRCSKADTSSVVESILVESSPKQQAEAVALLAAVADPVRWRLLSELAERGKRCVCDLQPVGGVAPNVLSYHLKVLRDAGLVTATRRGRWMDYVLVEDALDRLHAALPGRVP